MSVKKINVMRHHAPQGETSSRTSNAPTSKKLRKALMPHADGRSSSRKVTGATRSRPPSLNMSVDDVMKKLTSALDLDLFPWAADSIQYIGRGVEDTQDLFCYRQIHEFNKRFVPSATSQEEIRQRTLHAFKTNQNRLGSIRGCVVGLLRRADWHTVCLSGRKERGIRGRMVCNYPIAIEGQNGVAALRILRRTRNIVQQALGTLSYLEVVDGLAAGPGATFGVPYQDTSAERKLRVPITGTPAACDLFKRFLGTDSLFRDAFIAANLASDPKCDAFDVFPGSKYGVVPKKHDIGRGVVPALTANGFGQQAVAKAMMRRLRYLGLDLEKLQVTHQILAQQASLSGELATWDGMNASDNWMTEVVRWFVGDTSGWLWFMDAFREPSVLIAGSYVELYTYMTMGNATIFPLETLLFWAVACAVRQEFSADRESEVPTWGLYQDCSAYGDDVILPSYAFETFCLIIEMLGHQTNPLKSHFSSDDPFRESCGFDAFFGQNIRPVSPEAPSSRRSRRTRQAWLYILGNQLFKKYISFFGADFLYHSVVFRVWCSIFATEGFEVHLIPPNFPEDSGLYGVHAIKEHLIKMGLSIVPLGYDEGYQCDVFPCLRWIGDKKRDTPDPIRLWQSRHKFATYDPSTDVWINPASVRSEYWFSQLLADVPVAAVGGFLQRWGAHIRQFLDVPYGGKASCVIRKGHGRLPEEQWFATLEEDANSKFYLANRTELVKEFTDVDWDERDRCLQLALNRDWSKLRFEVVPGPTTPTTTWVDRRKGHYTVAVGHFGSLMI